MDQEQRRQLNARIAGALGYEIISGEIDNVDPIYNNGHRLKEMDFSGSWAWMGVLVEKAKEQGILLEFEHFTNSKYLGRAWRFCDETEDWITMPRDRAFKPPVASTVPMAVSLVYLEAKGITI